MIQPADWMTEYQGALIRTAWLPAVEETIAQVAAANAMVLGRIEFAHTGTLFLDEIAELPLALQPKLLRVIRGHELSRVGGHEPIPVDACVVAATSRKPEVTLEERRPPATDELRVVEIGIPPLRERKEDIPAFVRFFLARFNERYQRDVEVHPETLELFRQYSWPRNVRELEEVVRRLVVLGDAHSIHEELRSRIESARLRDGSSKTA